MALFSRAPASLKIALALVPVQEQLLDRSRCLLHIIWPDGSSSASLFLRSNELHQQLLQCSSSPRYLHPFVIPRGSVTAVGDWFSFFLWKRHGWDKVARVRAGFDVALGSIAREEMANCMARTHSGAV